MLRKHASLVIAGLLVALVGAACLVTTSRPAQRGQPTYVEGKHKKQKKPKKHKKVKHKKHKRR
jgi:hypothetical protein